MRKLYVDYMSQPARALVLFCRAAGIDVEVVQTIISKGQHLAPEYRAINPLGKVPCLVEDGWALGESATILRYLASTGGKAPSNTVADHWYPGNARARARVDSALDWHHGNVRRGVAGLVFNRVLAPNLGKVMNKASADEAEQILINALKTLERFWLKESSYVAGREISIADLLLVTELDMLNVLAGAMEGKSMQELLEPFPKVQAWMAAVAEETAPHHQAVSTVLMKASANFAKKKLSKL